MIAAARGLPIPTSDEILSKKITLTPKSPRKTSEYDPKDSLSPGYQDSGIAASHKLGSFSTANCIISDTDLSSPLSPNSPYSASHQSSSRPRSKTVAPSIHTSSSLNSLDVAHQEIKLSKDPYVNGKPIEVFLYKNATECPICFLCYPPHLNKTRCCDQPVCSECFVQIKRPDPHPSEHRLPSNQIDHDSTAEVDLLVSEPACCPYCQQPDFGVTYEAPSFRRGLVYASTVHKNPSSSQATPFINSENLNMPTEPSELINQNRRRTSISASAPTVITIDKIRPDWAIKLASARSHLARRSAAATALHAAAYLIGNGNSDTRGFNIRQSRHNRALVGGDSGNASESSSHAQNLRDNNSSNLDPQSQNRVDLPRNEVLNRRNRLQDIEELMMMEAIRLSLATEEERKKKAEKEVIKEAKKQIKEEKKREKKNKKEKRGIYGGSANAACGSSMSLNLPGLGRKRGSSVVSSVHREATQDDSEVSNFKGKDVDRRPNSLSDGSVPIDLFQTKTKTWNPSGIQLLDHAHLASVDENYGASPSNSYKESRTPQISNTSSSASSLSGSTANCPRHILGAHGPSSFVDSQCTTRISALSQSSETTLGSESNDGKESEPLLNFQSLAAMVLHEEDMNLEKGSSSYHIENVHQTEDSLEQLRRENDSTAIVAEELSRFRRNEMTTTPSVPLITEISRSGTFVMPRSSSVIHEIDESQGKGKSQDYNDRTELSK